ncbi:hypothetical protein MXF33_17245, partial [Acinetobacter baumannii]|nr:hypothetical protein [Acinetobacter baumannii]
FRTLIERRRDYIKKGRGFNEFCKINGAMYSYENTYNEKTNECHPRFHLTTTYCQGVLIMANANTTVLELLGKQVSFVYVLKS